MKAASDAFKRSIPLADIEKLYRTPIPADYRGQGDGVTSHRDKLACLLILDGVIRRPEAYRSIMMSQFMLDLGVLQFYDRLVPLSNETLVVARLWFESKPQRGSLPHVFVSATGRPIRGKYPRLRLARDWAEWVLPYAVGFDMLRSAYFARLKAEHPGVTINRLFPDETPDQAYRVRKGKAMAWLPEKRGRKRKYR